MKYSLVCPLCGKAELATVKTISEKQVLELWNSSGVDFKNSLFERQVSDGLICLLKCMACGFRFFDPTLAGARHFYEILYKETGFYYSNQRPEYFRTIKFAFEHHLASVLDVGCGTGFFLDLAKSHGLSTAGSEMNLSAAEVSRSKGHLMLDGPIQAWDTKYHAFFDLICLFQVLEHLPDPVSFLSELKPFLSVQGIISVAVPNRLGGLRLTPFEPSNWPPHHVSLWSLRDFQQLADRAGLLCIQKGADVLQASELFLLLKNRISHKRVLGQKCCLNLLLVKIFCLLYRFSKAKRFFPLRGHSIFAFFKSA